MRGITLLAALACAFAEFSLGQTYNWVRANDETVQLDPADYHTGRVYRPGPNGGNIHVGIAEAINHEWILALQQFGRDRTVGTERHWCHAVDSVFHRPTTPAAKVDVHDCEVRAIFLLTVPWC